MSWPRVDRAELDKAALVLIFQDPENWSCQHDYYSTAAAVSTLRHVADVIEAKATQPHELEPSEVHHRIHVALRR